MILTWVQCTVLLSGSHGTTIVGGIISSGQVFNHRGRDTTSSSSQGNPISQGQILFVHGAVGRAPWSQNPAKR